MEIYHTMDPVFATYLIERGVQIQDIEPWSRDANNKTIEAKKYVFNAEEVGRKTIMEFYGIGCKRERTSWKRFVRAVGALLEFEDAKLKRNVSRSSRCGCEVQGGETVWVTSNQAVAAYMLYADCDGQIEIHSVLPLGRDKGYLFVFKSKHGSCKVVESQYEDMLRLDSVDVTWWDAKCYYKLATSIRKELTKRQ